MQQTPQIDPTPGITKIFQQLAKRIKLQEATVLDVFGGMGRATIENYIHMVGEVEAWDKDISAVAILEADFPRVRAVQADTFSRIKSKQTEKFDIIVVDNWALTRDHVEHFDLFPHIYNWLKDPGYIIALVMPNIYLYTTERRRESLKVTEEWVEELTAARRKWYKQPDIDKFSYAPGDFEAATFFMTQRYDAIAQEAGLDAKWSTWLPRNEAFIWVAHELRKIKKAKPKEKKSVKKPASSRKRKVAKP